MHPLGRFLTDAVRIKMRCTHSESTYLLNAGLGTEKACRLVLIGADRER